MGYSVQRIKIPLTAFSFKHTGLFPEQAVNWDWFSDKIRKANRPVKVLNLFAYTGGATLAAAAAGASVTHVDASKGMVNWAKENAQLSGLREKPIRWLVDDCVKFVEREIRRGNHYDGIIMDLHHTEEDQRERSGRLRRRFIHLSNYVQRFCPMTHYSSL